MQATTPKTLDDYIEYQQNQVGKNRFMQKPKYVHAHTLHLNFYLKIKAENETESSNET